MTTIADQYIQELKDFRREHQEPGPARDEELADIIHEYHERAVRREDDPKFTIQWYSDSRATWTGEDSNRTQA